MMQNGVLFIIIIIAVEIQLIEPEYEMLAENNVFSRASLPRFTEESETCCPDTINLVSPNDSVKYMFQCLRRVATADFINYSLTSVQIHSEVMFHSVHDT